MTTWHTRIACWKTKATNNHSEYVILTAFPLKQWLCEHTSNYSHANIACIVIVPDYILSPTGDHMFFVIQVH
jgi:hypothetical protein